MARPKLSLADVQALIEANSPTSLLGRWFMENRDGFAETIQRTRPRWELLVVKFAEAKLLTVPDAFWDPEDTPARRLARKRAAVSARQIWHRVKSKARPALTVPQQDDGIAVGRGADVPRRTLAQAPTADDSEFPSITLPKG